MIRLSQLESLNQNELVVPPSKHPQFPAHMFSNPYLSTAIISIYIVSLPLDCELLKLYL